MVTTKRDLRLDTWCDTSYILLCLCNILACTLTCTAAECEAQSPLGAVEHHVEAFHNSSADHQAVSRRRHSETEAVQRAVHVCDWLDVQLQDNRRTRTDKCLCVLGWWRSSGLVFVFMFLQVPEAGW